MTRGWISLDGTVNIDNLSTTTEGGLMLGSGEPGGDMEFRFESGASVHFRSGWLLYNNTTATAASAGSATAQAIKYADSKVYVMQDWTFPSMTLEVLSGLPITLVAPGVTMSYDGVRMKTSVVEFELAGSQIFVGVYGLTGDDTLNLTKGNLPLYTYVAGTGNQLLGTGDISGLITFAGPGSAIPEAVARKEHSYKSSLAVSLAK